MRRPSPLRLVLAVGVAGALSGCGAPRQDVPEDVRLADAACQAHGREGYVSSAQSVCRLAFRVARKEKRRDGWN